MSPVRILCALERRVRARGLHARASLVGRVPSRGALCALLPIRNTNHHNLRNVTDFLAHPHRCALPSAIFHLPSSAASSRTLRVASYEHS